MGHRTRSFHNAAPVNSTPAQRPPGVLSRSASRYKTTLASLPINVSEHPGRGIRAILTRIHYQCDTMSGPKDKMCCHRPGLAARTTVMEATVATIRTRASSRIICFLESTSMQGAPFGLGGLCNSQPAFICFSVASIPVPWHKFGRICVNLRIGVP